MNGRAKVSRQICPKVWKTTLLAVIVVAMALGGRAQSRPALVQARMVLATDAVHPGSKVKAAVVAQISSGYHINDHKPTLDYLIPTELRLEAAKPLSVTEVFYPRGEARKFGFADTPISVYEGALVVGAIVDVLPSAAPGEYSLKAKLSYQACNDQACFPPASAPVTLTVKVVGRNVALKPVNEDVIGKAKFE